MCCDCETETGFICERGYCKHKYITLEQNCISCDNRRLEAVKIITESIKRESELKQYMQTEAITLN